jgi:23S rRNA (uracil1939-C5)-methyltransferase
VAAGRAAAVKLTMPVVKIETMTFGPFGVGRLDGKAVMAPGAAPGDVLEIALANGRGGQTTGRIERIIEPSAHRRTPPCPYYARCGGCDWQQIDYAGQVEAKAAMLAAAFRRGLGIELDTGGLIEPAPAEFGYRARTRFKVGPGGKTGFRAAGSHTLVEVDRCMVAAGGGEAPRALAAALGGSCAEIETVIEDDAAILVARMNQAPRPPDLARARAAMAADPRVRAVVLRGGGARATVGDVRTAIEVEPGCAIESDADAFSQVNREQNRKLVAAVMAMGEFRAGVKLLDLFCGSGNFSLPAARRGAEVIGVDADAAAIAAATANAARMGLAARFVAMKADETARFLARAGYRPDVAILDPPRTGAAELIEAAARLRPAAIIYVACDVATMVRDLKALAGFGYRADETRGFDFFPNTHHLEVVARVLLT